MSLEEMQILRENLTSEQLNAVLDKSRNILCLACAGSGKSRTLAYKIAYLVSQGESPESIIAFTFTEKAADSIKRRVAEALKKMGLPENYIGAMFIGTLDSFCQKLLGDIDASYRQFDVLDLNGLILFIMSRGYPLGVEYGEGYFNRITNLANSWQTANNENISLEAICNCEPQLGNQLKNLEKTLRGNGYMDFSYAIRLAAEELKKFKTKENTSIEKYKYLFVDEYQDINPIQEEFIKTLSEFLEMLFVVGDDDQSIYGWRGANVQNILTFEKRYSNVSIHKLLINFRSTNAIVETANDFVKQYLAYERLPKDIQFHSDGNVQDLRKLWFKTRDEEAEWIAERIQSLVGTTYVEYNPDGTEKSRRGLAYSDFAILLRSIHNSRGENRDVQFIEALRKRGIPYQTSGEGGIFDRPYAQIILEIMELLRSDRNDRVTAEKLFDDKIKNVFLNADKQKYFSTLQQWRNEIYAPHGGTRRKLYPQQLLYDLCDVLSIKSLNNETALRDLGLFSTIILDVEKIYISIDSASRYRDMLNFFQNIAKNAYELEPIDYLTKENAVTISTIHKVKGLEFPVVFVADMVSERFPGKQTKYKGSIPPKLMEEAIKRGAYGNRTEDEARLFYTAMTRAERILYLSGSEIHPGLKRVKKPSQFMQAVDNPSMRKDFVLDLLDEKIPSKSKFDESDFPTDYSSVKRYLKCPYSYKLSTIYGYNTPVPELFGFGKTSHTTLEKLHQIFKDHSPSDYDIDQIVEDTFMLKHVFPSKDPENRPGSYERAKELLKKCLKEYVKKYTNDFGRIRQDEARFELSVDGALITGAIDLLLKEDADKGYLSADVIDFKTMESPDNNVDYDWRDMSIQVQLYSKAAREITGENVQTGYIHTLKDNNRIQIPVQDKDVSNAVKVVEWAVSGIMASDFPQRACKKSCTDCDFRALCEQRHDEFKIATRPPKINTPNGEVSVAAVEDDDD